MGVKPNWTAEERAFLEDKWGTTSIPTIAKRLGRSVNAVKLKAGKMGLTRFLHCGEYITLNQLMIALEKKGGYTDHRKRLERKGCPIRLKKAVRCSFRIVYMNEFWAWAEQHKECLDLSRVEPLALGPEPPWAAEKRKADQLVPMNRGRDWTPREDALLKAMLKEQRYSYAELAKTLRRTAGAIKRRITTLDLRERPIPVEDTPWTEDETARLETMLRAGYSFDIIGRKLGRSGLACRGKYERILNPEAMKRYWRRQQEMKKRAAHD